MFTLASRAVVLVLLSASSTTFAETVEWWHNSPQDVTRQVLATPQGIYAVGYHCEGERDDECRGSLVKFATDGNIRWQIIDEPGHSMGFDNIAADDSGIYVQGRVIVPENKNKKSILVRKYSHGGTELWNYVDFFDGGFNWGNMVANGIAVDGDGVYVLSIGSDALVSRFAFSGRLVWRRFISPNYGLALAVGDGNVFAAGASITHYSTDGRFLGNFVTAGPVTYNGIAYHYGSLYYCVEEQKEFSLHKSDLGGVLEWTHDFGENAFVRTGCAVTADDDDIYVALNHSPRNGQSWRPGLTVRQYSPDGSLLAALEFPSLDDGPNSVSVLDGQTYVAGDDWTTGFTARLSDDELLPPTIAVQNPAGPDARLVLLDHHYGAGPVTALSQAADGSASASVSFSGQIRPVDYFAIEDLNGDGRDELVVLSRKPPRLEIADGASGAPLLTVPLNAGFHAIAAAVNERAGNPVVAVLMQHRVEGHARVHEFDPVTGARIATIGYNPNYRPLALVAQGEQSGQRRYAVLGVNDDPAVAPKLARKIEIRSTDMAYVQDIWLGRYLEVLDAVGFANSTGASRIAVLRRNADEDWVDIAIVDPAAGEVVRTLAFDGNIVPGDFVPTADIDMNLAPQFSIAGTGAADGKHRVQTRDLASGGVLHNAWVSKETPIQDLVYLPAGAGVPTPSLGLVVRDNGQDNRFRVYFVDLLTGTKSGPLEYAF